MSLIQELQDDIVNPDISLASILRRAKILAYRLRHDEFKNWVDHELSEYPESVNVPSYRRYPAYKYGNFRDSAGRIMKDIPIPKVNLPDNPGVDHMRKGFMEEFLFGHGVGALEELRKRREIRFAWPPKVVAIASRTTTHEGMTLVDAWTTFDSNIITEILEVVRNKLLDFVLELQDSFPELAESDDKIGDIPPERTTTVFNNYILGNTGVVAVGDNTTQHIQQVVHSNDLSSLLGYLKSIGVSEGDAQELKEAVEEDGPREKSAGFGPRVGAWLLKKMPEWILNAATANTLTMAVTALAQHNGWLT